MNGGRRRASTVRDRTERASGLAQQTPHAAQYRVWGWVGMGCLNWRAIKGERQPAVDRAASPMVRRPLSLLGKRPQKSELGGPRLADLPLFRTKVSPNPGRPALSGALCDEVRPSEWSEWRRQRCALLPTIHVVGPGFTEDRQALV